MTPHDRTLKSWDSRGRKHGLSEHPLYETWSNMLRRCHNKRHDSYPLYGGRGIYVCNEWRSSPQKFIDFALRLGWKPGLTIDRKDNNLGYTESNIRLATSKIQNNNTSRNRLLEFEGQTHTMAEWADIKGMPYGCLQTRIQRGWSVARALSTPARLRIANAALLGRAALAKQPDAAVPAVGASH